MRAIERLHRLNVYIGDINPQNVLVKDENNISIVDMDSVQVEGFPCPVGTDTFTPAQRQGMNYADFLRTRDDELFAVTTLLFMIIFPGNAPYTSQGGGEAAENIRNHRFAYGRDADGRPPVGAWQFIWSHLHPALKDDFIKVFKDDGRVPIGELIKHLLWYQNEIREGKRSGDIFPDKPRMKEGDTELVQCDSCPSDRPLHEVSKTLAEKLRLEGRAFRCSHCAALRKISRLEQTREVECTLRLSPQCAGKTVAQSSYLDMLRQKGQDFWCKPCSEAMRLQRQSGQRYRRRDNYSAGSSYGSKSNSPCFVATATYQSDSAPQVVFLRAYRDQVLRRTLAGRAFIEIYYRLGPLLAKPVQRSPGLRAISRRALDALVNQLIRNRSNWKLD